MKKAVKLVILNDLIGSTEKFENIFAHILSKLFL